MLVLVTGSAGHLGEGLVRTLRERGHEVRSIDRRSSPFTTSVGSICDERLIQRLMAGVEVVFHTATLHKPHIPTRRPDEFVETNIGGTLRVLESALAAGVSGMVFTSSTTAFGAALRPVDHKRANWVDENLACVPKDIYGTTKKAAEDICEWFYRAKGFPTLALRVARFFPEPDHDRERLAMFTDANIKANEILYRRVELDDVVEAHMKAAERVGELGFERCIVSSTAPFERAHLQELRRDAPSVVRSLFPEYQAIYQERGWKMLPSIDRVYVNARARALLDWQPQTNFEQVLCRLRRGENMFRPLTLAVGAREYAG